MRALTVKQPWTDLIMAGVKDVENRTKPFPSTIELPARIGIHAAASVVNPLDAGKAWQAIKDHLGMLPNATLAHVHARTGVLLGFATVTGCHHANECKRMAPDWSRYEDRGNHVFVGIKDGHCSRWAEPDVWHWQMTDPEPLDEPVPMRGMLGLWALPELAVSR